MLDVSLKVLKKIEDNGFKAYIVGGFVRDYIIGRSSSDVDIATNATPMQIKEIFPNCFIPNEIYGSITVIYDKIRFEITTFRKELLYENNRKPIEIEYINDLEEDLKRRDFTINTLCINNEGKIIDLLGNERDVHNKIIKTVSVSEESFREDSLRILRAVRFATVLDFELDEEVVQAISKTKKYLSNISYHRKKSELDKIFMSKNALKGVMLLINLELDKELEILNLSDVCISNDLLGVWASLEVSDKYPFTKNEKELIKKIKKLIYLDNLDNKVLYMYGPYVNSVAMINKGLNSTEVIDKYNNLPIKVRNDINITAVEIMSVLDRKPGKYINEIFKDLEDKILYGALINDTECIRRYILKEYGD